MEGGGGGKDSFINVLASSMNLIGPGLAVDGCSGYTGGRWLQKAVSTYRYGLLLQIFVGDPKGHRVGSPLTVAVTSTDNYISDGPYRCRCWRRQRTGNERFLTSGFRVFSSKRVVIAPTVAVTMKSFFSGFSVVDWSK